MTTVLAAYRLGERVAVKAGGREGSIIEVVQQSTGYWYHIAFASGWHWFIESALERAETQEVKVSNRDDNGWEWYVPPRQIEVTIRGDGLLRLSEEGRALLGDYVQLGWHSERRAIAMRAAKARDDGAIAVEQRHYRGKALPLLDIDTFLAQRRLQPKEIAGNYKAAEEGGVFVIQLAPLPQTLHRAA